MMRCSVLSMAAPLVVTTTLAAEEWVRMDGVMPALIPGETTILRVDSYATADIKVDAGGLVVNGGPAPEAVQSVLGALDAGWYTGTKTPIGNGGTIATIVEEGTTLLASASSMKGGYTALKTNACSAEMLSRCDSLRISFDTGVPLNTSKMAQPQNFSLFYSIVGQAEVVKVGETWSGTIAQVKESSFSWTLAESEYRELFSEGGSFYLVLNSGELNASFTANSLPVSNFSIEGHVDDAPMIPEPSGASLALVGVGGFLLKRRRR